MGTISTSDAVNTRVQGIEVVLHLLLCRYYYALIYATRRVVGEQKRPGSHSCALITDRGGQLMAGRTSGLLPPGLPLNAH